MSQADPDELLVCVVEIPKGAKNKYEYDEHLGGMRFDRHLMSAAAYPTDYGYLRGTLGLDGDPLDALVCMSEPSFPGCLIPVRAIAMFKMQDEHGIDDKIVCVPIGDPNWSPVASMQDLPQLLRDEIEQFFAIYKELEHKRVDVDGWRPREEALAEVAAARDRFQGSRQG